LRFDQPDKQIGEGNFFLAARTGNADVTARFDAEIEIDDRAGVKPRAVLTDRRCERRSFRACLPAICQVKPKASGCGSLSGTGPRGIVTCGARARDGGDQPRQIDLAGD
jgi:hypothetical protein